MSHVRPDTCAFEYTEAFQNAARWGVAETQKKRDALRERIATIKAEDAVMPLLVAAYEGYSDWLEFQATLTVVPA